MTSQVTTQNRQQRRQGLLTELTMTMLSIGLIGAVALWHLRPGGEDATTPAAGTMAAPAVAASDDRSPVLYLVSTLESAAFLTQWTAQLGGERAVVVIDTDPAAAGQHQDFGVANTAQAAGPPMVQVVDLRQVEKMATATRGGGSSECGGTVELAVC